MPWRRKFGWRTCTHRAESAHGLLVHIFVFSIRFQTVIVIMLLAGILAVGSHWRRTRIGV